MRNNKQQTTIKNKLRVFLGIIGAIFVIYFAASAYLKEMGTAPSHTCTLIAQLHDVFLMPIEARKNHDVEGVNKLLERACQLMDEIRIQPDLPNSPCYGHYLKQHNLLVHMERSKTT